MAQVKNPPASSGDKGSIPGSEISPGGRNGNPLQYSCLENSWTEEPGGLQSIGLQRVGHTEVTKHARSSTCCLVAELCLTLLQHHGL